MRQHRHQKQQRQRLLDSLPAAPARLFIKQLLCLPLGKNEEEGGQEVEGEGGERSIDPATATCRLVLGDRHVEEVRCLGMVVKHGEAGTGLWLDDGTGVVYVVSSPQTLLPPVGQLCEVVGPLKLCRIALHQGQQQKEDQQENEEVQQQQPQSPELQRAIAARHVFVPQDPNVETAFTLSTLELFRTVYIAQILPLASHQTPYYAAANGPSPPPPPQSPSAPPSPSSSSSSSSSASTDGVVISHILHLHANGEGDKGVDVQALQALIPSVPSLEASLSRLQMDGLVYCLQGSFYPL